MKYLDLHNEVAYNFIIYHHGPPRTEGVEPSIDNIGIDLPKK